MGILLRSGGVRVIIRAKTSNALLHVRKTHHLDDLAMQESGDFLRSSS